MQHRGKRHEEEVILDTKVWWLSDLPFDVASAGDQVLRLGLGECRRRRDDGCSAVRGADHTRTYEDALSSKEASMAETCRLKI